MINIKNTHLKGFTLIELLTVMTVVAILSVISLFAIRGARMSGRDARRKSDLESIRSSLELFRADCRRYPASIGGGGSMKGTLGTCSPPNSTYMQKVPQDPNGGNYIYGSAGTFTTYELCANMEDPPTPPVSCASGGNYRVTNP